MVEFIITQATLSAKEVAEKIEKVAVDFGTCEPTIISLYPKYVESAGLAVGDSCNVAICAIVTGSLYSYPEVAALESSMAIENGADQIEVALDSSVDIAEAESYLQILADEVEDVADLAIVIDENCCDIEKVTMQAIKAASHLRASTISYGVLHSPTQHIATIAAKIAQYNNEVEEGEELSLRVTTNLNYDNYNELKEHFVKTIALEEFENSGFLKIRVKL